MQFKQYPITGTFIDEVTYDIPAQNWSDEQWAQDLDNMKAVGMDTVIIMRSVFYNKCLYPTKTFPTLKEDGEDFVGLILREAQKRDMKVSIPTAFILSKSCAHCSSDQFCAGIS